MFSGCASHLEFSDEGWHGNAGGTPLSPLTYLESVDSATVDVLSTDLFDTVLLRDISTQNRRFDEAAIEAATRLGLDPDRVSALRRSFHDIAYKAVAAERPLGDASLRTISRTVAAAMGAGDAAVEALRDAEVDTDIRHLAPHDKLIAVYRGLAAKGIRVIATTDTYYSPMDIRRILAEVVGEHPILHVYVSSDIGLTKHSGALFAEVARREGVCANRILHVGDDRNADVHQARKAGWQALHLPRAIFRRRIGKLAVKMSCALRATGQPA
jgi:FMN phosphatase YigB (HAD superfamily)